MTEDVLKQLSQNYSQDLSNSIPYRDGFILNDKSLPYSILIRKSDLSADRIMFNHLVKSHLISRNFKYTDRYIISQDGLPYTVLDNQIYILISKINGTEALFENMHDTAKAAVALASMHRASVGASYDFDAYPFSIRDLGKLPDIFKHRTNELKKFRKMAAKGKSFFDYEYVKLAGAFIEDGERTIAEIQNSKYNEMVEQTLKLQILCHHDFTSHNVIFNDGNTYLTGFDNCCVEIKEYDIANFIRRKMRRTGWALPDAKNIIDNYRSVFALSDCELEVLKIILRFPQKFWRIVNKYYNSRRSWCERSCLDKIHEVVTEKETLDGFLDNFNVLY